jgi:hypothetical protein
LSFVAANLLEDDGWPAAVEGARYVLHVALASRWYFWAASKTVSAGPTVEHEAPDAPPPPETQNLRVMVL